MIKEGAGTREEGKGRRHTCRHMKAVGRRSQHTAYK